MGQQITLTVNGKKKSLDLDPKEPLLYVLRNDFELNGPKYGCGVHQCGSCLALVDGKATYTCLTPAEQFEGKKVETIEGMAKAEKLHPLQQAFYEEQAAQCGYCLNGMLVAGWELLNENPKADKEAIKHALDKVICRCGTHSRFVRAIERVASKSNSL